MDAMNNIDRFITCKTLDDKTLSVKVSYLLQSGVFRQMYNDLNMELMSDTDPNFLFPVSITLQQLEKVCDWCENHAGM